MQFRAFLGAVLATALAGGAARAETISFDFTAVPIGLGSSFTYGHPSGLSLLVTGSNQINSITSPASITRSYFGLGVVGLPKGNPFGLDNYGSVESLIFDFTPHEVVINRMRFNFIDASYDHDEVKLTVIGNGAQTQYDISTQGIGSVNFDFTSATPLLNAQQRTGMKFIASTPDWNDNYTITGMTVDFERAAGAPVVVPGPSAILGGGALLVLSGFHLWTKKRHASDAA